MNAGSPDLGREPDCCVIVFGTQLSRLPRGPSRCDMTSKDGLIKSVTRALRRIADGFVEMEKDSPHECEFCGDRAKAGQRFCDEHEAEFVTRH